MPSPDAKRRRAFTLIEVMAAAVILALVVAWLSAAVGKMNLREGDSRRRAGAALYADRLLTEIEEAAARGAAPPLGKREVEEGIYQAAIEIAPLDPALMPLPAPPDPERARGAAAPADVSPAGWLASPAAEANPPVLQASVRVTGKDGVFDAGVSRTTFFLNPAALKALEEAKVDGELAGDGEAPDGEVDEEAAP
jgi:prepilin-type N-terminal cleavage/methylation domain-containing protein